MDVVTSGTGKWASNELPVRVQDQSERMLYTITKGTQAYANASFYFTDGEGNPLKIFYHSTAVPRPTVPGFTSDCHVQTELIDMRKMLPTDVAVDEDFEAVIEVMALQDTPVHCGARRDPRPSRLSSQHAASRRIPSSPHLAFRRRAGG